MNDKQIKFLTLLSLFCRPFDFGMTMTNLSSSIFDVTLTSMCSDPQTLSAAFTFNGFFSGRTTDEDTILETSGAETFVGDLARLWTVLDGFRTELLICVRLSFPGEQLKISGSSFSGKNEFPVWMLVFSRLETETEKFLKKTRNVNNGQIMK